MDNPLPELNRKASELSESVENHARGLCPWLPDPYRCDECGVYCMAEVTWDARMVEYTPCWTCPECQRSFYREEPWYDD